jgi:1-deoxy-D-xylulose-5-phosphate synthase
MAASDEPNLRAALEFMRGYEDGPSFLRYPRDNVREQENGSEVPAFELGRAVLAHPPAGPRAQLAVLAYGTQVQPSIAAARELEAQGYDIAVYDARFAKPVDLELLRELTGKGLPVVTVEDHLATGGFGSAVLEALNEARLPADGLHRVGMPERWIGQGSRGAQLAEVGLDAAGIRARVEAALAEAEIAPRRRVVRDARGVEVHS